MPRFSIEEHIPTLEYTQASVVMHNIELLKSFLSNNNYKYGVRDDSRFVFNWAQGQMPDHPLNELAEEINFIQWLSDSSNYHSAQETGLRRLANELKADNELLSWGTVWRIVKAHGPDLFKYTAVDQMTIPSFSS